MTTLARVLTSLVVLACCCMDAAAQQPSITKRLALKTSTPLVQGEGVVYLDAATPTLEQVVLIELPPVFKWQLVKAKRDGKRVTPTTVAVNDKGTPTDTADDVVTLAELRGKGTYDIEIVLLDPVLGIRNIEETITLDDSLPPDDGPDGPDIPPGPFDNLAARVAASAALMQPKEKQQLATLLSTLLAKIQAGELIRTADCASYLSENKPASTPQMKAFWELLYNDSKGRTLSWQDTVNWYSEIARGLK